MPEKPSTEPNELQQFYNKISPIVESASGVEPQMMIRDWNAQLFIDMRREAEMIMLMHGQSASDRYLYGFCTAIAGIREENGGSLPPLTDNQYEMDREVQDSHRAAQDASTAAYFYKLEEVFEEKFPLTRNILYVMENDLRTRLKASAIDIEEGFIPGWYKAVKVAVPLFMEER